MEKYIKQIKYKSFIILTISLFQANYGLTNAQSSILVDPRDGKEYKTVQVGGQLWMAQNLAYKPFINHKDISTTNDYAYCYDNSEANCEKYGVIYNWNTAQNVCPSDWHLPTKSEFQILITQFGKNKREVYRQLVSGGKSGLDVELGGYIFAHSHIPELHFYGLGKATSYWTSTDMSESAYRVLFSFSKKTGIGGISKNRGYYVRCIKD